MKRRAMLVGLGTAALVRPARPGATGEPARLKFRDLYAKGGALSDAALALDGAAVAVEGYMAPPLKALATWCVLTRLPMSYCPFCESEAEWPEDILVLYAREPIEITPYNFLIRASGRLELGPWTDPDTGFWSKLRLRDTVTERV